VAPAAFALGLAACAALVPSTNDLASPRAASPADAGVVEAIRAYLRTFKLNERDLPPGLAIPAVHHSADNTTTVFVARVTGRIGPLGHQVYDVAEASCAPCLGGHFIEIAPE